MKTTHNNRKSKFLAFLLSVMMVSTAGAMFASCADGDDSSSSTSSSEETKEEEETRTDDGVIKNANFDFTKINTKTVIGTSVTGWSRSVNSSRNASNSASGVIDTAKWDYMTTTTKTKEQLEAMSEADVIAIWDDLTAQDKLTYYDVWKAKEENKGKTLSTSTFEKYESLNVDAEDLKLPANPGTHTVAEGETLDSNVLMIHNNYYYSSTSKDKPIGTAQKWTSSSTVNVPAGTSAKVSVWVKTADLKMSATGTPSEHGTQDAVGKGAYISLTHSVGGKSLDAYEVKNIDVDDWTQYTFYIRGSNYAETTYSLVLGLGQGDESNRFEYVNGFAFFDDIQCEIIENSEFETATKDNETIKGLTDDKIQKSFDAYEMPDAKVFGMDFATADWGKAELTSLTVKTTEQEDNVSKNPTASDKDVIKVGKKADFNDANNSNLKIVYDKFLEAEGDNDFVTADDEIFLMLSNNGTAYTVDNVLSNDKITLAKGKDYMAISFYVKTSDMNGGVGAGVTLTDALNKTSFSSIDTTDIAKVKIGDDEDAYDGWQRVFFFIERGEDATEEDIPLSLTFNYGPTDILSSTSADSFQQGFAAFTKFEVYYDMSELEYEAATTGTYAKKVTVFGEKAEEAAGNGGFDTAVTVPSDALENGGYANLQNYKGVYNDSYRVSLPTANESAADKEAKRAYNNYFDKDGKALAGLLNRENVKEGETWAYGNATQPLVIDNSGLTTKSYGFIGNTKSLSEEYTAISLRVMTTEGAKASVYLMDMSDETRQTVLSVGRSLTYWYDADGNLCTDDNGEMGAIAFNLDKSGLYKANKNWVNYSKLNNLKDAYFANLNAYTEKDGILYANENSANHYYAAYNWEREVFYKHENAWYTEPNGQGVRVYNLADITEKMGSSSLLKARYLPTTAQELKIENISSDNKWTTVTFYIRKGESAKDYRLEVWSGTRDGKTVNTKGIVAFDTNNPGTASSNFDTLIEEFEDTATSKFDGVFSYFDTDMHVRFDAEKDTEKRGNAYEDNAKATLASEASTAYLKHYSDATGYNVFADYSLSDKTVAASEQTDDDHDHEDSSDEETTASAADGWLLASSIAVAAVLVLAVASVAARKILDKVRRNRGKKVRKEKAEKAPKQKKVEKTVDEDSPYND
ncbi:MAG: hypothetical protein E7371_04410 [Clostridiales bacterium]|nr:hypothetical protein [Clostridiales bacterium]